MALMHELNLASASGSQQSFLNRAVWQLFNATKDQSISVKVWGFPISVKVAVLRPIIERWVGVEIRAVNGSPPFDPSQPA